MDISATWICDIRNFVVVPLEEYVLINLICISLDEIIIIWIVWKIQLNKNSEIS